MQLHVDFLFNNGGPEGYRDQAPYNRNKNKNGNDDGGATIDSDDEEDEDWLSYEILPTYASLIPLANKQICAESLEVFSRQQKSLVDTLSMSISDGSIVNPPSAAFLSICRRSRFVFLSTVQPVEVLEWLRDLGETVLDAVRSMVIEKAVIYAMPYGMRFIWAYSHGPTNTGRCDQADILMEALPTLLPNLREISIFVPDEDDEELYLYCGQVPEHACEMLLREDNTVKLVRFFFHDMWPTQRELIDGPYLRVTTRSMLRPPRNPPSGGQSLVADDYFATATRMKCPPGLTAVREYGPLGGVRSDAIQANTVFAWRRAEVDRSRGHTRDEDSEVESLQARKRQKHDHAVSKE